MSPASPSCHGGASSLVRQGESEQGHTLQDLLVRVKRLQLDADEGIDIRHAAIYTAGAYAAMSPNSSVGLLRDGDALIVAYRPPRDDESAAAAATSQLVSAVATPTSALHNTAGGTHGLQERRSPAQGATAGADGAGIAFAATRRVESMDDRLVVPSPVPPSLSRSTQNSSHSLAHGHLTPLALSEAVPSAGCAQQGSAGSLGKSTQPAHRKVDDDLDFDADCILSTSDGGSLSKTATKWSIQRQQSQTSSRGHDAYETRDRADSDAHGSEADDGDDLEDLAPTTARAVSPRSMSRSRSRTDVGGGSPSDVKPKPRSHHGSVQNLFEPAATTTSTSRRASTLGHSTTREREREGDQPSTVPSFLRHQSDMADMIDEDVNSGANVPKSRHSGTTSSFAAFTSSKAGSAAHNHDVLDTAFLSHNTPGGFMESVAPVPSTATAGHHRVSSNHTNDDSHRAADATTASASASTSAFKSATASKETSTSHRRSPSDVRGQPEPQPQPQPQPSSTPTPIGHTTRVSGNLRRSRSTTRA
ncbi:hypothetical protein CXG81DRAFT_25190 [Caulochytrium protostelioides]|uniref:Uncharacterized protein n=1 Tax=Caulochytrium protostelioides TaxID=1555241 RepID=A0A4P9X9Y9_9FUNG|nr:hypothetical protein CXG81DRAFT_25190 [Caulochytrium protostelioides]|eukprot:RKP02173.1 hypothetical protein CXG81DRAFT_25190 [Caulochytrium protostelioides]